MSYLDIIEYYFFKYLTFSILFSDKKEIMVKFDPCILLLFSNKSQIFYFIFIIINNMLISYLIFEYL